MALAELLRSLEEDAEAQVRALLSEARAEAGALRADRAGRLARRRAEALDLRRGELETAAARTLDAARREGARAVLEARAEALARVRARAEARLAAADSDALALTDVLAAALAYLGAGPAVVEAPPSLHPAIRRAAPDPERMTLVPAGHGRRLVVRSADGRVSVDASGESRLARAWPRLAIALAPRLEPQP